MTRARFLLTLTLVSTAVFATAASAETVAIVGGRIFPVSGPPIDNGTVVITGGRITAVGANVPIPADARRIDAAGRWITPGLFDAATQLGLVEIGMVEETDDATAKGQHEVAAAFRAWEGLNPQSVLIPPARNEGVTTVGLVPTGGLIAGQAAIVDLADGSRTEIVRRAPAAMVAQITSAEGGGTSARGELLMRLREVLQDARTYSTSQPAFESNNLRPMSVSRLHLAALLPVVQGKLPLLLAVERAADIENALALAEEFKLRLVLFGASEAWQLADRLAAAKVPVMTGALGNIPSSFATLGARQENAAILRAAGVAVALVGDLGDPFNVRNIRQQAGNAVAYGLPWDEALRAVTETPARIFGVDQEIGTLAPGRVANVVVWSGDPFEFSTRAEHVFIRGQEVQRPSRQDELTERYKALVKSRQ